MKYSAMLVAAGVLSAGTAFAQQGPIKIGVLYPLTGGGAVYGVPAMAGHQLAIEELNAKGGIMGRKIESIERDDKLNPAAASSTMKELITKDKVDIVLGGLASSVGLAMSEVSKQEKVVYISTIPKSIQITTDKLHKHVFRTSANTDQEGDTMALLAGKNKLSKICHLQLDYAYGNDLEVGILKALPKHAPDAKVVLTLKPKLGATDFNPFIPQVMAAGCDGVLSGLWGPHFVSWVKQAAPLGFFNKIKWISGGEVGILKALPKHAPDAKVVLTLKPKLGATDFNPFIPQVMAAGCDGVLSGLWGPHFVSWVKQAAPLGFFNKIKWISGGEIGSHEIAGELKAEYPDNVISNAYELWYTGNDPSHKEFQAKLAKKLNTQETPQWAALGYIGVMYAAAAMEKAKSTDPDKVAEALEGLSIGTPVGKLTIDPKTHQANIGQFWGPMVKKPDRAYRMMEPAEYIQPK